MGESIADFVQRLFKRPKRKTPDLGQLQAFATERKGVEGYVEPRTSTNPLTLLLVDRDGDHVRAAINDRRDALAFCERSGIPVYDAQVIGYPRRMRDFESRRSRADEDLDARFADLERRLQEPDAPDAPDR